MAVIERSGESSALADRNEHAHLQRGGVVVACGSDVADALPPGRRSSKGWKGKQRDGRSVPGLTRDEDKSQDSREAMAWARARTPFRRPCTGGCVVGAGACFVEVCRARAARPGARERREVSEEKEERNRRACRAVVRDGGGPVGPAGHSTKYLAA